MNPYVFTTVPKTALSTISTHLLLEWFSFYPSPSQSLGGLGKSPHLVVWGNGEEDHPLPLTHIIRTPITRLSKGEAHGGGIPIPWMGRDDYGALKGPIGPWGSVLPQGRLSIGEAHGAPKGAPGTTSPIQRMGKAQPPPFGGGGGTGFFVNFLVSLY